MPEQVCRMRGSTEADRNHSLVIRWSCEPIESVRIGTRERICGVTEVGSERKLLPTIHVIGTFRSEMKPSLGSAMGPSR